MFYCYTISNIKLDIAYCIVASKGINDQPDDGTEEKGRNMLLFLRYAM
jgi:hypothetical protein